MLSVDFSSATTTTYQLGLCNICNMLNGSSRFSDQWLTDRQHIVFIIVEINFSTLPIILTYRSTWTNNEKSYIYQNKIVCLDLKYTHILIFLVQTCLNLVRSLLSTFFIVPLVLVGKNTYKITSHITYCIYKSWKCPFGPPPRKWGKTTFIFGNTSDLHFKCLNIASFKKFVNTH